MKLALGELGRTTGSLEAVLLQPENPNPLFFKGFLFAFQDFTPITMQMVMPLHIIPTDILKEVATQKTAERRKVPGGFLHCINFSGAVPTLC